MSGKAALPTVGPQLDGEDRPVSVIAATLRIMFGFVAAALVAGLVQVLFVAGEEIPGLSTARLESLGLLMLLAAAQSAVFAAPLALPVAVLAARRPIRSLVFFLGVGLVLAAAGFFAQQAGDGGGLALLNRYVLAAYLSSGLLGGLAYWFLAVPKRPASRP